ncbi:MAG: radical SAM protein [Candidatus Marinimicrobia bacterium]|nr:radical SAM protein [Candidatus Neomarinimicrobiota bacterium]
MKILLLNPPFLSRYGRFSRNQRSPAITKAGTFYYPIWLAYATGVLEREGHQVKLLDAVARRMNYGDVEDFAKEFQPELIVVETSTPSIYNDAEIGARLKYFLGKKPFVFLVGTHPSTLPEETLKLNELLDGVARGEYDYIVRDLARVLSDGRRQDLETVEGLSFRDEKGEICHNPPRAPIVNLDALPFVSEVYKKHLNIYDYFFGGAQYPVVQIISGRGCPNRCVWCVWPQVLHGRRFRPRSAQNVVDELEFISKEMPEVKDIGFEDDTLTIDQRRTVEICDMIMQRGLKVSWYANIRVNLKLETMLKMKKAGCRFLIAGFESGSQEILRNIRKGITLEMSRRFMENARKAKLLVHGCFVAGNPGETKETLEQTLNFALQLNPDTAQFFPMMVYPGTEAYEWAKRNGYLDTEDFAKWVTEDGLHNCVVSTPEMTSRELVEWCDMARRVYYLRLRYIFYKLWQTLLIPSERVRNIKQLRHFYKYLFRGSFR